MAAAVSPARASHRPSVSSTSPNDPAAVPAWIQRPRHGASAVGEPASRLDVTGLDRADRGRGVDEEREVVVRPVRRRADPCQQLDRLLCPAVLEQDRGRVPPENRRVAVGAREGSHGGEDGVVEPTGVMGEHQELRDTEARSLGRTARQDPAVCVRPQRLGFARTTPDPRQVGAEVPQLGSHRIPDRSGGERGAPPDPLVDRLEPGQGEVSQRHLELGEHDEIVTQALGGGEARELRGNVPPLLHAAGVLERERASVQCGAEQRRTARGPRRLQGGEARLVALDGVVAVGQLGGDGGGERDPTRDVVGCEPVACGPQQVEQMVVDDPVGVVGEDAAMVQHAGGRSRRVEIPRCQRRRQQLGDEARGQLDLIGPSCGPRRLEHRVVVVGPRCRLAPELGCHHAPQARRHRHWPLGATRDGPPSWPRPRPGPTSPRAPRPRRGGRSDWRARRL